MSLIATLLLLSATGHQTSLRTVASFSENPNNKDLYSAESETANKALLRHSLVSRPTTSLKVEANVYALILGASDKSSGAQLLLSGTDEHYRSSRLERHWHETHRLDGFLTVDRLNVGLDLGAVDFTVGRLPVNMSTTAVFTPNDFFAPFRAHNGYREYKPGVDATRIDYALGDTGQLSVLGIAGYKSDSLVGRLGPSEHNRFSYEESAVLGRASYTLGGFETALLGGKLGPYDMAGFTLQGDVGDVGLRAEGHQKKHRVDGQANAEVAAGAEMRISPSLIVHVEQYSHGAGYAEVEDYKRFEDDPDPPLYFLSRDYSALGATFEATPLTSLRGLSIFNLTDGSAMVVATCTHSLSESGEISVSYLLPRGRGPRDKVVRSEYGAYPRVLTIETGVYF